MSRMIALVLALAVPAGLLAQEKEKEAPKPSYIGVQIAKGKDGGVVVLLGIDDGPAKKAGLKGGDVIMRIDGTKPADLQTAVKVIKSLKPGKKVKFEIKRDGKDKTIEVTPVEVTS